MKNLTVKILYSQATMGEPTLSNVTLTAVRRKTGPGGELRPAEPPQVAYMAALSLQFLQPSHFSVRRPPAHTRGREGAPPPFVHHVLLLPRPLPPPLWTGISF